MTELPRIVRMIEEGDPKIIKVLERLDPQIVRMIIGGPPGPMGPPGPSADGAISIKDSKFGNAQGDGTADDTDEQINALDWSSAQHVPVFYPPGQYRTTAQVTQADHKGNWEIFGPGATILHDFASPAGPPIYGPNGSGTIGPSVLVTANLLAGASTIPVADSSLFATGDIIAIRDLAHILYNNGAEASSVEGEACRVSDIPDATHINIWGSIENNYTLVDDATWDNNNVDVRKIDCVYGISIHDISFEDVSSYRTLPNPNPPDASAQVLNMGQLWGARFERVNFKGFFGSAIRTEFGLRSLINACRFIDFDVFGGYCWLTRKCSGGIMMACFADSVRHIHTTTGNALEIPPQHILLIGNMVAGQSTAASYDAHSAGKYLTFAFNEDASHRVNANSGDASFQPRCLYTRVVNNRVTGGGHDLGVSISQGTDDCEIAYNEFRGVKSGVSVLEVQGTKIHHNRIFTNVGGVSAIVISRANFVTPMVDLEINDNEIIGDPAGALLNAIAFGTGGWSPTFLMARNTMRNCQFLYTSADPLIAKLADAAGPIALSYNVIPQDNGRIFNNTGCTLEPIVNLIKCRDANRGFRIGGRHGNASPIGMRIKAQPGDRININSNVRTGDGSYIETFDPFAFVSLYMDDQSSWQVESIRGEWIVV